MLSRLAQLMLSNRGLTESYLSDIRVTDIVNCFIPMMPVPF